MTYIRSAARVSRILVRVATQPSGATAREIAEALELPLPTAYHLLGTLVSEGLLAKDARRRYQLGPTLGTIANAYVRQLTPPEFLVAPLHELATTTGETAYLASWRDDRIAVLASVEGRNAVRVSGVHLGIADDVHARASGKVLLAFAPETLRTAYLRAHPLVRVTKRTIVEPDQFQHELERTRQRGFAIDEEEFREGVACAAVPVLDNAHVVATYAVSAPAERFRQSRDQLVESLREAAQAATIGVGRPAA
ncbi:MAG TPA: IclR family transcriptional regulator [Gaiellaceae bacterium]|nr:IclR family transcriptional regulator [Gaiellaceae bacterium]